MFILISIISHTYSQSSAIQKRKFFGTILTITLGHLRRGCRLELSLYILLISNTIDNSCYRQSTGQNLQHIEWGDFTTKELNKQGCCWKRTELHHEDKSRRKCSRLHPFQQSVRFWYETFWRTKQIIFYFKKWKLIQYFYIENQK